MWHSEKIGENFIKMKHYNKPSRRGFLRTLVGAGIFAGLFGINKIIDYPLDSTKYKIKSWYEINIKPNAPDKTVHDEYNNHALIGMSWDEYLEMVYEKNEDKKLEGKVWLPSFEGEEERK